MHRQRTPATYQVSSPNKRRPSCVMQSSRRDRSPATDLKTRTAILFVIAPSTLSLLAYRTMLDRSVSGLKCRGIEEIAE